jgi:hypothetical protein
MSEPTTDALDLDAIRVWAEELQEGDLIGGDLSMKQQRWLTSLVRAVPLVCDEIERQAKEIEHYRNACITAEYEVSQTLGKALGYEVTDSEGRSFVAVGDHTATSLASEAADRIQRVVNELVKYLLAGDYQSRDRYMERALMILAPGWKRAKAEEGTRSDD